MQRQSTRRRFLTTVGVVGTASLAGCSNITGGGSSSKQPTASPQPTQTSSNETTSPGTDGNGSSNNNDSSTRGTAVDDFEGDVSSRWGISYGKYTVTKQDAFQGSQSLVLEPKKNAEKPVAKIFRSFYPDALDLSKHDLSLAVKVNKPKDIKIAAEIIAPAESSMLTATRYIPLELTGGFASISGTLARGVSPSWTMFRKCASRLDRSMTNFRCWSTIFARSQSQRRAR
ncbi:hypothetical protein ACFQL7_10025 [Halocatena marina]|uniref:Tat pathway signal sequence domain protein n=1 Tax=Halocatena marina TaxID=2934937 RepID=A0ABD5YQH8_9EURY